MRQRDSHMFARLDWAANLHDRLTHKINNKYTY